MIGELWPPRRLREEALTPFDKPGLRNLLNELKRASELVIDNLSSDVVISSAFDPAAAERMTTSFRSFIDEQQDEIVALQILLGRPGKLLLGVLASIAEFETDIRKERQREGIDRAKAAGVYKGRRPSIDVSAVRQLHESGAGPSEIAKRLKIGRASVYRALGRVQ